MLSGIVHNLLQKRLKSDTRLYGIGIIILKNNNSQNLRIRNRWSTVEESPCTH